LGPDFVGFAARGGDPWRMSTSSTLACPRRGWSQTFVLGDGSAADGAVKGGSIEYPLSCLSEGRMAEGAATEA